MRAGLLVASLVAFSGAAAAQPTVKEPHPLITEILYAVPPGAAGDAGQDGKRSATGDEFIELFNPHDKPINLKGYVLVDASREADAAGQGSTPTAPGPAAPGGGGGGGTGSGGSGGASPGGAQPAGKPARPAGETDTQAGMRFTFPEFTLGPGEVVVVFNGYEGDPAGGADAVGDSKAAPKQRNAKFNNAWVFSMKTESRYAALGNAADCVLLKDPSGKPVQCVRWARDGAQKPRETAPLLEDAPESRGSVQRSGVNGPFAAHSTLPGKHSGVLFSPGVFEGEKKR